MNLSDVELRLKRKNKILFRQDSEALSELQEAITKATHKEMILWAFELAEELVATIKERYPEDERPRQGLYLSREWAQGLIKMPQAKRAILTIHQMAKEVTSPIDVALIHALGQGLSTVHLKEHAIGLPMYQLSSLVFAYGLDEATPYISDIIDHYLAVLKSVQSKQHKKLTWADFLNK